MKSGEILIITSTALPVMSGAPVMMQGYPQNRLQS